MAEPDEEKPEKSDSAQDEVSAKRDNKNDSDINEPKTSESERPTSRQSLQQPFAVSMTNTANSPANRPPSSSSIHSNGSPNDGAGGGPPPPRTTAMSRRGGRTRSRSPSSMNPMNRPPSVPPSDGSQQQQHPSTPSQSQQHRSPSSSHPPASPANPSAAAAAAAAAAKSLHRNGGSGNAAAGSTNNTPTNSSKSNISHPHSHHRPPPSSFYGPGPDAIDRSRYGSSRGPPPPYHPHHHPSRYGSAGPPPPSHLRAAPGYYDPHGYSSSGGPPPPSHRGWPPQATSEAASDGRPPSRSGATSTSSVGSSSKPSSGGTPGGRRDDHPYGYQPYSRQGGAPLSRGDPYHHRYGDDSGEYSRRPLSHPHPSHYPGSSRGRHALPPHHSPYARGGLPPPGPPGGSSRTTSPHPSSHYPGDYRGSSRRRLDGPPPSEDMYGTPGGTKSGNDADGNNHNVKSTKTVIGTATPIHVPRAGEPIKANPSSSSTSISRRGSADIFRGRPGSDMRNKSSSTTSSAGRRGDDQDDSSPQKILMALRTPSNSFEEKKSSRPDDNLSPQDPPQLRNAADTNLFFDPQRSPKSAAGAGPPQQTNSLDMAPSFSLFNQSFDSLGDTATFFNVGGPLDSALQSTSFGATASILDDKGELQLTASNGTFKLNASSSGGALTFGMSPTNSFGNGPTSSFSTRVGNIQLLGNDHRAASPSQVLVFDKDIYRSSSMASPHPKSSSMDDGMRLSGSNGSPSYARPYAGDSLSQHGHYQHAPMHHHGLSHQYPPHRPYRGSSGTAPDGSPYFYTFLRKHKDAFREVTFLLPGVKQALMDSKDTKKEENDETPKRQTRDRRSYNMEPSKQDTSIAQRRVASAVCAFGGTFLGSRINSSAGSSGKQANSKSTQSIFRGKSEDDSATVTPSSSDNAGPKVGRQRAKYDDALPGRYYENDNRLSWEFEENPPIGDFSKDDEDDEYDSHGKKKNRNGDGSSGHDDDDPNKKRKLDGDGDDDDGSGEENEDGSQKNEDGKSDQPKMRYRCKLCGQPKQNHTCPYQQSLARSIGTMVYPAVNAFTSAEPGVLAPALSEMNNFVGSGDSVSSAENSPSRPTPDRLRRLNAVGSVVGSTAQVTPESLRGTPRSGSSPANFSTPQRSSRGTPGSMASSGRRLPPSASSSARKKRSHAQMGVSTDLGDQADLLFVESMDLKPEQFRMVTPSKAVTHQDAFTYPSLPLPYAQRKRLSDNLFSLSKEVPQLTDECASVLREARERDLWDLAVAELMTQVVVVVHCHDSDTCFEGLRRYLLTLGISC